MGVDYRPLSPARNAWRHFHFGIEAGVGLTPHVTSGDPSLGLSESSGGLRPLGRAYLGWDFTELFFTRLGGELRVADPFGALVGGPDWLLELGTRICNHFETGLRGTVGQDRVASSGLDVASTTRLTLVYGTSVFLRLVIP